MKKLVICIQLAVMSIAVALPQSIGIAEEEFIPHETAALEIKSSNKGILIPRMSKVEREGILNPADGLLVFQVDDSTGFYYSYSQKWFILNDGSNDLDPDPKNEIQSLSLTGNELTLSEGGSVTLPSTSTGGGTQNLSLKGDTLFIENGNYVLLSPVADNLGNHIADENIQLFDNYISYNGNDEGISLSLNGDVSVTTNLNVLGATNTNNLNVSGLVNLGVDAIQSSEIEANAITTAKIANSQITGVKLHPMGASVDQYLKYNGTQWIPSDMPKGLNYIGAWNALNNLPYITNSVGASGNYYVVSIAGNQNLGSGTINFSVGDWVIHNGTSWEKIDNSNDVTSVFGRKGSVVAQFGDYRWDQIDLTTSGIGDISDVNTSSLGSGQILVSNGTSWNNVDVSGDVTLNNSGDIQINPASILYNNLQSASGGQNSVLVWNGTSWGEAFIGSIEQDGSTSNEIQDLTLVGSSLTLTEDGTPVDLSGFYDNTDEQTLSFEGNSLSISGGNTVDLSPLAGSGAVQTLSYTFPNLSISDGNSVDLSDLENTDDQTLSLTDNLLSIEDGNDVDLSLFIDNTDSQSLTYAAPNLSISDGNSVDLSDLLDDQILSLKDTELSIEDGNSVDLIDFMDNTDAQTLSFKSPELSITDGNTVDLSELLADVTDDQNLTDAYLTETTLTIEIETGAPVSVDLAPLQASLSDRRLKENIKPTHFGISDVLNINVVDYDFIKGDTDQTGFIAQELYKIYPNAVVVGGEDEESNPWRINYDRLTPILTKAVQDLNRQLIDLEKRNDQLEQENLRIREQLKELTKNEARLKSLEDKLEQLINDNN